MASFIGNLMHFTAELIVCQNLAFYLHRFIWTDMFRLSACAWPHKCRDAGDIVLFTLDTPSPEVCMCMGPFFRDILSVFIPPMTAEEMMGGQGRLGIGLMDWMPQK